MSSRAWLILLFTFYFSLRLSFLTRLPIFNDEAIYLNWGWRELHLPGQLFLSLDDAKPPLFLWLFGIFEGLIPDPLLAGRLVSVIAGAITLGGLYLIGKRFFDKQLAILAAFIYICVPIFSFFDRQALLESALGAVGIWSLYFLLCYFQKGDRKVAFTLGAVLGLGIFIKTSGILLIIVLGLLIVWWSLKIEKRRKVWLDGAYGVLGFLCILSPLLLNRLFWLTLGSNDRYAHTIAEIFNFPVQAWLRNFLAFGETSFWQLTPLVFLLGLMGLITSTKNNRQTDKIISFYCFSLLVFFVLLVRQPSPRYLVSFLPIWALLASLGLNWLGEKQKKWQWVLWGIVLGPALGVTLLQTISPLNYFQLLDRITQYSQKKSYVVGWPSGYGLNETREFLEEKARKSPIMVGVRLDSGNPEDAIFTYFNQNSQIKPVYLDAHLMPELANIDCLKTRMPFYYVSRDRQLGGLERLLQEKTRFYKPGNESSIGIYRVKPDCPEGGKQGVL